MLSKAERLTRKEISYLSHGKSVFGTLISVRFCPAADSKFSVSVSKKVASTAVERNRIRRRVYAAVEDARKALKKPLFLMLLPKRECSTVPLDALKSDISGLFEKASK